jgi:uncharacterized protein
MTEDSKVQPAILEMVRRIVEKFHPEKIILFGSHARGEAGPDSDVDLLVIMEVDKSARRKKSIEMDMALIGIPLPADIILLSPSQADKQKYAIGSIAYPAIKEGEVLYERGT